MIINSKLKIKLKPEPNLKLWYHPTKTPSTKLPSLDQSASATPGRQATWSIFRSSRQRIWAPRDHKEWQCKRTWRRSRETRTDKCPPLHLITTLTQWATTFSISRLRPGAVSRCFNNRRGCRWWMVSKSSSWRLWTMRWVGLIRALKWTSWTNVVSQRLITMLSKIAKQVCPREHFNRVTEMARI